MRQSTRLIINAATTYSRMALGFVIGILFTRELLAELGQIDFGLFMSVGAAWALLAIFISSLHSSGQRHLAYAVGLDDPAAASRTFSSLVVAHSILALVVLVTGLLAANLVLHGLDIPPGRATAATYIYYLSLVTLAVATLLAPYTSAMLANQLFLSIAMLDIAERLLLLVAVFSLMFTTGDKLIYWAMIYAAIQIVMNATRAVHSWWRLSWVRLRTRDVTWKEIKEILFFANWLLVSSTIMRVRLQGTLLMFNYFFGNAVAAAQGVTMQLVSYQNQMAFALTQVVAPVLTAQAARNNLREFHRLILLYSKFATLAAALISIVLLAEIDVVLKLWLEEVPPYTTEIAWWTLLLFQFNKSVVGYSVALQARAKMAGLVLLVQLPELMSIIPIVGYLLLFDAEPWHVPAAFAGINAMLTLVVLPLHAGRILELPMWRWFTSTALPLTLVMVASYVSVWCLRLSPIPELGRVLLGFGLNALVLGSGGWYLCLNRQDRATLAGFVNTAWTKLCRIGRTNSSAAGPTE